MTDAAPAGAGDPRPVPAGAADATPAETRPAPAEGHAGGRGRSVALAAVVLLIVLAALTRLPDLATRGTWDADQGHDMLVLRSLVRDGVVPLLGPPTSIGDFHHGAFYYYLLAPAAWLTGGDSPLAVTAAIALAGIAAVVVTWWLASSIAGPAAGFAAGLLMALSASAIDESTFIWNPNLIALSSALALAGAWRAWSTGRPRWWLLAAAGTAMTMQCHVLGVTLLPVIGALWVADIRRRPDGAGERPTRRDVVLFGLAGLALIALTYVPLAIHELTTDFAEIRAALVFIEGGGGSTQASLPVRALVVLLRVVSWPLSGLITTTFAAALTLLGVVVGIVVWRWRSTDAAERVGVRWLGLGLAWTAAFLTMAAPSLAVIVPGLPNDHYHAFADPMVFILVGIGFAVPWRAFQAAGAGRTVRDWLPAALATAGLVAIIGLNVTLWPPAAAPDGGFPAAEAAAARIAAATGDRSVAIRSLPVFKSPDTFVYPLTRDGIPIVPENETRTLVIVCDSLFETAIGAPCGGPAESASLAQNVFTPLGSDPGTTQPPLETRDQFEAAPGRWVTVYVAR